MEKVLQNNSEFQRLYINSFTQKTTGTDCNFTVDLGTNIQNFRELSVDQVIIENKFTNFYQSQKGDFRDLSLNFTVNGVNNTRNIQCVDYVTYDQFINYMNTQIAPFIIEDYRATSLPAHKREYYLSFRIKNAGNVYATSYQLLGYGWEKLGFQTKTDAGLPRLYLGNITAQKIYDFASPPHILVSIDQIHGQGVINNQFGSALIPVFNNVSFGDRISYINQQKSTCNVIYFQSPQTLRYLNIRLLSCDQMQLQTPGNDNNDLEVIIVLSCR